MLNERRSGEDGATRSARGVVGSHSDVDHLFASESRHHFKERLEIEATFLQLPLKLEKCSDAVRLHRCPVDEVIDGHEERRRFPSDTSFVLSEDVRTDLVPIYQGSFRVAHRDLSKETEPDALVPPEQSLHVGLIPSDR